MKEFKGECFGVALSDHDVDDKHQCFSLLVEDDGIWHEKMSMSTFWIDEAIAMLQAAKAFLDATCDKGVWGYDRRSDKEQSQ